jgi:hypothetical protein
MSVDDGPAFAGLCCGLHGLHGICTVSAEKGGNARYFKGHRRVYDFRKYLLFMVIASVICGRLIHAGRLADKT